MAEFPLPVLQIWRSRKRVAIQIHLMNIHVSECKYNCLHLVPKFGDVRNRHNWQLHPTFQEGYGKGRSKQSGWFMSIQQHVWKSRDKDANPRLSRLVQKKTYWNLKSMSGKYGTGLHPLRQVYFWITVKTLPGRNVTWSKRPRLGQNVHGHQVKTLPAIYVHYSVMNVISEWHSSTNVDP